MTASTEHYFPMKLLSLSALDAYGVTAAESRRHAADER